MKLTPLSEITDQIIAAVTEHFPQASMVYRFDDDCHTLPREEWLIRPAIGEVKLKILDEIRERRVTVRTPLGTPSSHEYWADNLNVFSRCVVDEAAAQYLLSLWGIKPDEAEPVPVEPKIETETDGKPRRQRSDSLDREINVVIPIIKRRGLPVTANTVMGQLGIRAENVSSCIKSFDGAELAWKRSNGTIENLNIDALRMRLIRRGEIEK